MSSLAELNDILFQQLKRLSSSGLSSDQINDEVKRSNALVDVSDQLLASHKAQLLYCNFLAENNQDYSPALPKGMVQIEGKRNEA